MTCPRCGLALDDLDPRCPRCEAGAEPSPQAAARLAWERQALDYVIAHTFVSEDRARDALRAANWDLADAVTAVRGGRPLAASPARQRRTDTRIVAVALSVLVGFIVLGCGGYVAFVVYFTTHTTKSILNAQSARKAEDVRAINEAAWLYAQDTGQQPARADDLAAATGPRGYKGPYLTGAPVDPFSQQPYVLREGQVVGPADVTTFAR